MEWDVSSRSHRENYEFLCGAVAPRPIAWLTTVSNTGLVNAAPFSWFNAIHSDPPMVMIAIAEKKSGPKDTIRNLRANGEMVVNIVTRENVLQAVATSAEYPADVSEVTALGLKTLPSTKVRPPRLAASPIHLEAVVEEIKPIGKSLPTNLVLARIVHAHADDAILGSDGVPDAARLAFSSRMGHQYYADTTHPYVIDRPPRPNPGPSAPSGAKP